MTITGPYPNKRQRRGKDSTRYRRPTVKKNKKMQKKSLSEEHIVYSDIIFAKIFTIKGTHNGLLKYLCKKNHFRRNTKVGFDIIFAKKSLSEEH